MTQFRLFWALYCSFFRISSVTFGGGYAMLPILQREVAERKKWVEATTIVDDYAISQALPGIISVNVSAFLGHQIAGVGGAIAAVLGILSPCILIITVLATGLTYVAELPQVQHALAGVAVCVSALILRAVVDLWRKGIRDRFCLVLCVAVFFGTLFSDLSPVLYILLSALVGLLYRRRKNG